MDRLNRSNKARQIRRNVYTVNRLSNSDFSPKVTGYNSDTGRHNLRLRGGTVKFGNNRTSSEPTNLSTFLPLGDIYSDRPTVAGRLDKSAVPSSRSSEIKIALFILVNRIRKFDWDVYTPTFEPGQFLGWGIRNTTVAKSESVELWVKDDQGLRKIGNLDVANLPNNFYGVGTSSGLPNVSGYDLYDGTGYPMYDPSIRSFDYQESTYCNKLGDVSTLSVRLETYFNRINLLYNDVPSPGPNPISGNGFYQCIVRGNNLVSPRMMMAFGDRDSPYPLSGVLSNYEGFFHTSAFTTSDNLGIKNQDVFNGNLPLSYQGSKLLPGVEYNISDSETYLRCRIPDKGWSFLLGGDGSEITLTVDKLNVEESTGKTPSGYVWEELGEAKISFTLGDFASMGALSSGYAYLIKEDNVFDEDLFTEVNNGRAMYDLYSASKLPRRFHWTDSNFGFTRRTLNNEFGQNTLQSGPIWFSDNSDIGDAEIESDSYTIIGVKAYR